MGLFSNKRGGLTNERPASYHVIWGPMRGIFFFRLKIFVHTFVRTSWLLDRSGQRAALVKSIEVSKKNVSNWQFVIFEVVKKPEAPTKMELWKKKKNIMSKIPWKSCMWCLFFFQKFYLKVDVFGFYNEGKPYVECITEEVFRWHFAGKWCKTPQKSKCLQLLVKKNSHKDNSYS